MPAYLGQLTAVAVVGRASGEMSRWLAVRHAIAYVAGFGSVFTILGITATYVAGPLVDVLPLLRQVGGVVLIVMGLNLAGILKIPALERTWRPLDAGAAGSLAERHRHDVARKRRALPVADPGSASASAAGSSSARGGWLASFGLGAIFAIGWTPCIGVILGGILTMAATSGSTGQGALLLVAYTLGLGIPFLLIAAAYDRAPALIRPLVRHGRVVSLVGGLLVALIGVAMLMDWLALLARYVPFNTSI